MPCAVMKRRSWLAAITFGVGRQANSDVDTFFERLDESAQDGRHVPLLQPHFDQRKAALVVGRGQRIAKLPWRERPEPAPAPEIGELAKGPADGLVVGS